MSIPHEAPGTGAADGSQAGASRQPPAIDVTGRDRMARNVLANWAGYAIMVATGFLAPRVMDRQLGQEALGIWDFGWSLVSYVGLTRLGVGASINRYVAMYRARGDVEGLRRTVSSVSAINGMAGLVALAFTLMLAWMVPRLIRPELTAEVTRARWLVILLGTTIALELALQVYHSVLSGCHRFDVQAGISTVFEVSTSLSIIAALLAGGGLITLGIITLTFEVVTELARFYFAHRVCPELRIRLHDARWDEMKHLLRFGLKAFIHQLSSLLLIQANKLIVGGALGLAALAVFSRPLSLTEMAGSISYRFASVFTPTASSMEGSGQEGELRQLVLEGGRMGLALALPMVLFLAVMGDLVMLLWMGPRYEAGWAMPILALGFLGTIALWPIRNILLGTNRHGRPALASLVGAVTSALLGLLNVFVLHWGLVGAALALAVPTTLSNGLWVAAYTAREFRIAPGQVLREAIQAPLLCAVPFLAVLALARWLFASQPLVSILVGGTLASLSLVPLYWRWVLPEHLQDQIRSLASRAPLLAR